MSERIAFIQEQFKAMGNPVKVAQFQKYLKTTQPMYGINAGPRKDILALSIKKYPIKNFEDYLNFVQELWTATNRELQYCAIDTAVKFKKFHLISAWSLFERMALSAKWWDLADGIAVNLVGSLLLKNRSIQYILDDWMCNSDLWVRRISLLAHLKHKNQTHTDNLSRTIITLTVDKQFFIQKAIGWSLREYSKTDARWVLKFIDEHGESLSNLAIREGTKYLNKL